LQWDLENPEGLGTEGSGGSGGLGSGGSGGSGYGDAVALLALLISIVALIVATVGVVHARSQAVHLRDQAVHLRDEAAHLRDQAARALELVAQARTQALETGQLLQQTARQWHALVTPQFDVILSVGEGDPEARRPRLRLHLVGPVGLDRLDVLTVKIRDDPGPAGAGQLPEDAEGETGDAVSGESREAVRGPYRFEPGTDGTDEVGRAAAPALLEMDDWHTLQLERTEPPDGYPGGGEGWRLRYPISSPVLLLLHCERSGYRPWDIRCEASPQHSPWVS
jgi:hypothetical protein